MHRTRYILTLLLISLSVMVFGQAHSRLDPVDRPPQFFGSGGSNYSLRDPGRLLYRNGLRTSPYNGRHHLVGFYGNFAYSMNLNTVPGVSNHPGGWAWGAGLTYEFQDNFFMLQVDLGLEWQTVTNRVNDVDFYNNDVTDAWGYPYSLHYEFYDRIDRSDNISFQIPVLAGGRIRGLYMLCGLKFNIMVSGQTIVRATGTTTGIYEQYLGLFEEMDNHGLRKDVPLERGRDKHISISPNLMASAEIGYEWGKYSKKVTGFGAKSEQVDLRFRIAAFCDITIINFEHNKDLPSLEVPDNYKWDFPAYQLNHALASDDAKNKAVHSFFAGAKITVLFGFKAKERCVLCTHKNLRIGL